MMVCKKFKLFLMITLLSQSSCTTQATDTVSQVTETSITTNNTLLNSEEEKWEYIAHSWDYYIKQTRNVVSNAAMLIKQGVRFVLLPLSFIVLGSTFASHVDPDLSKYELPFLLLPYLLLDTAVNHRLQKFDRPQKYNPASFFTLFSEWRTNFQQIPASFQPLIVKLYREIERQAKASGVQSNASITVDAHTAHVGAAIIAFLTAEKEKWAYIHDSLARQNYPPVESFFTKTLATTKTLSKFLVIQILATLIFYMFLDQSMWDFICSFIGADAEEYTKQCSTLAKICDYELVKWMIINFVLICCCLIVDGVVTQGIKLGEKAADYHQHVLMTALKDWYDNSDKIPTVLQPIVNTLYHNMQQGKLTQEQCNTIISGILSMSAFATENQALGSEPNAISTN